jgi:hypothetical protein
MSEWKFDTPIHESEPLGRYIVFSRWIRNDETLRPDAFEPQSYVGRSPDLSVTRIEGLTENQLWAIGRAVASSRRPEAPGSLQGYAAIQANAVRRVRLEVTPDPVQNNPNHANIIGWPLELAAQKSLAQELASMAHFVRKPIAE